MKTNIKKRLSRIALLSIISCAIGAGFAYYEIQNQTAQVVNKKYAEDNAHLPVAGIEIKGDFSLNTHLGKAVTNKSYTGQHKLIYFGFTYCPAICPTELQKISQVMNILDTDASEIQPLFITVDPERDTETVMESYVGLFHPALVGLTGTNEQIQNTIQNFRVFARKVHDPDMSDYTIDHSSYIYLMGPHDQLLGMYRIKDTAEYIANDVRAKL